MATQYFYNKAYTNRAVYPKGSTLNVRALPSTTSTVLIKIDSPSKSAGRTTGNYFDEKDGRWFQCALITPAGKYGYVRQDVILLSEPKTNTIAETQAENLVNDLIQNDIKVYNTLLRCFVLMAKWKKQGVDVQKFEIQFVKLWVLLSNRQRKIKYSELVTAKQGYDVAYKNTADLVKAYWQQQTGYSISAIPVIALVIIGVVIGAGLSAAAYYAFKPDYEDSKKDLVISETLEKALKTLTPAEQEEVKKDLETQIDDAYNAGKEKQSWSDMFSFIKPLALIFGGYLVVTRVIDHESKRNKKQ
jgi:hypothetical protein